MKTIKNIGKFLTIFVGIGAFFGGICMLIDPSGELMEMDALLPYFDVLPFSDILFNNYIFSGISLIIVNGVFQVIPFYLLMKNNKYAIKSLIGCGILLMLWICIQFYMFPLNFMDLLYFGFGLVEFICGIVLERNK